MVKALEIGCKVSFTIVRRCGRNGWRFLSRIGILRDMDQKTGWVVYRGRTYECPIKEVKRQGKRNALTIAMFGQRR